VELASYSYWPSFAWGLIVLAAFAGWGCAAARVARIPAEDRDWALSVTWGMAVVIAIGGVLALFGLANRAALIAIAIAGCGFAVTSLCLWSRPRNLDWGAAAVLAVTMIVFYAPSVASRNLEPYDDYLAYFPMVHRLLDTGSMIDPFSFRRLSTYGGQSLLDALAITVGSEKNMNVLDAGIAMVALGGLIYSSLRLALRPAVATACTIAALLVPIVRHNTMSQATGVLLWLALYRTFRLKSPVLAGLLLAALCTLRSNYIGAAAILALAALVPAAGLITTVRDRLRFAAAAGAGIVCWALLLYRSSGSPVYPLFAGFARYSYSAGAAWSDRLHAMVVALTNFNALFLLVPLAVALIAIRGAHVPFSAAALLGSLMIPMVLPFSDPASVFRYVQPIAFGSLLIAVTALIQSDLIQINATRRKQIAVVLALMMFPLWGMYAVISVKQAAGALASLPAEIADETPLYPHDVAARYRRLESAVPEAASVYAIVPLPSLFDYKGHRVLPPDLIGCASPPPGMPFFRGPAEVKEYLLSLGIEYIAYNDFDHPSVETGYWRWWWRERAAFQNPVLKPMTPYVLDLMENVDRLAASEGLIFRDGDLSVIRLNRAPATTARGSF
jgi:hypothetical protein